MSKRTNSVALLAEAETRTVLQGIRTVSSIDRGGQQIGGREDNLSRRRYQKGQIFKRGKREPKWFGSFREDIVDSNGNIRRVRRTVKLGTLVELPTRKLARRRMDQYLARINAPGYRPGRVATVAEFVSLWREHVLAHRKPSTAKAAESHLKLHLLPHLGSLRLDEVDQETAQRFVSVLARSLSRHSIRNVLGTLGSILHAARSWGYICFTMVVSELAIPCEHQRRAPRFFSAEHARTILAECREEPFRTMFAVAAMTGIRPGELCALQVEDIDFNGKRIFVRNSAWYGRLQTPKTPSSAGVLPMPEPLEARLKGYLASSWRPNELRLLFPNRKGRPYSANNIVQRKLWPILDKLGIPRCGLHAFRHTHSSLLLDIGAPATVAQAQLRHADPRITLGTYSHVIGDSQRKAVERIAAILEPNGVNFEESTQLVQ